MTIEIHRLRPVFRVALERPDMVGVRTFIEDYCPDAAFEGILDPDDPIIDILERPLGRPPLVEILFNIIVKDGSRQYVRCTISRRGLFPTVGVVMLTADGRLVLFDEFRPQSGRTYISVPSGCKEDRESMVAAALREGRGEAGFCATNKTEIFQLLPYPLHGALLAMMETVFVVTNVAPETSAEHHPEDSDEWIFNCRCVTPLEFAELVRNSPDRVHVHGPTLACVAMAQAHGFFLPSAEGLAALARVREGLHPLVSE